MFSILAASKETIKILVLNFEVLLLLWNSSERLWDLRFPRLESLIIGAWCFSTPSSVPEFTQFLLAHGRTLVELDVAHEPNDYFGCGAIFQGSLRPDALPNLTVFRGHAEAFLEMVDARMECLRSLLKLKIGPGGEFGPSTRGFHEMFDGLDRWQEDEGGKEAAAATEEGGNHRSDQEEREPVLRSLTDLELDLDWSRSIIRHDTSNGDVLKVMKRCAEHFGKTVEVWIGTIDFPIKREEIIPVFGRFERLKQICLNQRAMQSRAQDYVLELATRIPTLEEVTLIPSLESLRITRDGCVPRVVNCGH
jgi:hypothetical protein